MKDALWLGPLTALVMTGTFFAAGGHDGLTGSVGASVAIAGLVCLALLTWRRSAELTVLAVGGLLGLYFALGFDNGPVYVTFFVAGFLGARAQSLPRLLLPLAAALLAVMAGLTVRAGTTDDGFWQLIGQATVLTALTSSAVAIGATLRTRSLAQSERTARAATEEQLRMAQDLHDGVGHGLAVIAMQAGVALHVLDRDPVSVRQALEAIRDTSRESLDALRLELSRLSGAAPRAPRRGLADLEVLAERVRAAGLSVSMSLEGSETPVSPEVGQAAYLIVQEALTNVLRHANAGSVAVVVEPAGPVLRLRVRDDGAGKEPPGEGMGISGMRYRAAEVGGSLVAGPRPGGGYDVVAELPL